MYELSAQLLDTIGIVTLIKERQSAKYRRPAILYLSIDRELLESIQQDLNIPGVLVEKNRGGSYELRYLGNAALEISSRLVSLSKDSSKVARMRLLIQSYRDVTPRNGKYSPELRNEKLLFEQALLSL